VAQKVAAKLEIFEDNDDGSQTGLAVETGPPAFQSELVCGIVRPKLGFRLSEIEWHLVGFEDNFDKIEAAFLLSRSW
jgi:hypothetical protein